MRKIIVNSDEDTAKIKNAILTAIPSNGEATWQEIVIEVEKTKILIKNWLTQVRDPMQELIDSNKIKRIPDIFVERYEHVK